jgi:hypothetical protein
MGPEGLRPIFPPPHVAGPDGAGDAREAGETERQAGEIS